MPDGVPLGTPSGTRSVEGGRGVGAAVGGISGWSVLPMPGTASGSPARHDAIRRVRKTLQRMAHVGRRIRCLTSNLP